MTAYYNEIDPYAAQWLRNLIAAGYIAPGDVDERSILDVRPDDLRGYAQCHFFAGIGGWSVALRLAGWSDDRPVWTGSCPCQPFSAAGAGKAADDSRHLWPAWFPLIAERRPPTVFGEQVEAAIGWGWLDSVFADLEGQSYACGAAVLPACGVGAPHIRQRLWFVADASGSEGRPDVAGRNDHQRQAGRRQQSPADAGERDAVGIVGLADSSGRPPRGPSSEAARHGYSAEPAGCDVVGLADAEHRPCGESGELATAQGERIREVSREGPRLGLAGGYRFWSDCDWLPCTDGKARPVEPGSFPLAHGVQRRASKLRAYGNAIVPQVASEFIKAIIQCTAPS